MIAVDDSIDDDVTDMVMIFDDYDCDAVDDLHVLYKPLFSHTVIFAFLD